MDIQWTVTQPNGDSKIVGAEKVPYVAQVGATQEMSPSQREFTRIYNLMRNTLLKHGLMEEK